MYDTALESIRSQIYSGKQNDEYSRLTGTSRSSKINNTKSLLFALGVLTTSIGGLVALDHYQSTGQESSTIEYQDMFIQNYFRNNK